MATAMNNGGGFQNSSEYPQVYNSQYSAVTSDVDKYMPLIFFAASIAFIGGVELLRLLCCRMLKEEEETSRAGGLADRNPSTAAALEMAPMGGTEPPLVCTYRKSDGWNDDSCGVCLAELADGEAVRVLPACMHFFHAACVNEWLHGHGTCPLCRAPLIAPANAAKVGGPAVVVMMT